MFASGLRYDLMNTQPSKLGRLTMPPPRLIARIVVGAVLPVAGCQCRARTADLGPLDNEAARKVGAERNPVIVLPRILESTLAGASSGRQVSVACLDRAADPDTDEGARRIARRRIGSRDRPASVVHSARSHR